MSHTRRIALATLIASALSQAQPPDDQNPDQRRRKPFPDTDTDPKLPNGKSQKDAIAHQQHAEALKEAGQLLDMARQLEEELKQAGNFVVPVATLKRTEDIEKLARKIRGHLKS